MWGGRGWMNAHGYYFNKKSAQYTFQKLRFVVYLSDLNIIKVTELFFFSKSFVNIMRHKNDVRICDKHQMTSRAFAKNIHIFFLQMIQIIKI